MGYLKQQADWDPGLGKLSHVGSYFGPDWWETKVGERVPSAAGYESRVWEDAQGTRYVQEHRGALLLEKSSRYGGGALRMPLPLPEGGLMLNYSAGSNGRREHFCTATAHWSANPDAGLYAWPRTGGRPLRWVEGYEYRQCS